MKKFYFGLVFCFLFFSCGISECESGENKRAGEKSSFSIANWNVQTFFDGHTDGSEYKDFKSAGKWSNDKYHTRLTRLCEVITKLNADIFVLEEIENESVIYDISNQLAGNSWDSGANWTYSCFAKEKDSSIGCAVLSKFPLFGVKTHSLFVNTQKYEQPSMRPLLEVSTEIGGREITIFVNHWKSKSSGEYESEIWRDWQESVLAGRLKTLETRGGSAVICGDFNRDASEFILDFSSGQGGANTLFRHAGLSENYPPSHVKAYSPWFSADGSYVTSIGSYFYKGSWERIDHIFSFGKARIAGFTPKAEAPWANEDKTPAAYKIYNGNGYSDHLPIMANVIVK